MNNKIIDKFFPQPTVELSRRSLLTRAVSTAGFALSPLLNQLALADSTPSQKFVIFVEGNGVEPVTMLSPKARSELDKRLKAPIGNAREWYKNYKHKSPMQISSNDLSKATSLGAISDLQERANVIFGLSSKISGGGHSNFHGGLSCTKTINRLPGGPTIDALLAKKLGGNTPFEAIRAGVINSKAALDFGVTASAKGKASPVIMSPNSASDIYFAPKANAKTFAERLTIFDSIRRGIDSSLTSFPSGAERAKLESYAASIEVLAKRHERLSNHRFDDITIPTLKSTSDLLVRYEQQVELATAALIGGLTNVVVLPIGTGGEEVFNIPYGAPYNIDRHNLHHQAETKRGAGSGAFAKKIHAITGKKISFMSKMAQALAATPDTNGKDMLANTLMVYLPDTGERHHSQAAEWPILTLGGESMGVKGGRTLVYPGIKEDSHRQLSNFWNTLGHLAGLDLNDFGDEDALSRKAEGPLSEFIS